PLLKNPLNRLKTGGHRPSLHYLLLFSDLPEQLINSRIQLRVTGGIGFSNLTLHWNIDWPRIHLHNLAVASLNSRRWQADDSAIDEWPVRGVQNPSGCWLTHNFAELQRTVALSEILRVGKRVLIGNKNCRYTECALSQLAAAGRRRLVA